MKRIFVADTNLFFECRMLEDLPWAELKAEVVVIALTKPVLSEIDKHKKGGGRTRKRALETFGRVRDMLTANKTEAIIRNASPRVILQLAPALKPDQSLADVLDYSVNDDRIIGIACAMEKQDAATPVALLTDDGGAAATAQSVGLDFVLIDPSWKRPLAQTTEAKKIAELKKDIAVYRAQEPDIQVRNALAEDIQTKVVRRVARALLRETIDGLMDRLEAGCPPQGHWTTPENETQANGTVITYLPANPESIETYRTETYPAWLATCRSTLEALHEGHVEHETEITLTFAVLNKGSRPASRMRIAFEARGDVMIMRPSFEDEDPEDEATAPVPRPTASLPKPPKPPKWSRTVSKPSRPSKGLDLATLRLAAQQEGLLRLAKGLPGFDLDAITGLNKRSLRGFLGPSKAMLGLPHTHIDLSSFAPFVPEKHNPEVFYATDWPCDKPVRSGAYACDLFRHQGPEELFDVDVVFPEEGDAKGVVICTVQAENLTEPVELTIPISRAVEEFDLTEVAAGLVSACIE